MRACVRALPDGLMTPDRKNLRPLSDSGPQLLFHQLGGEIPQTLKSNAAAPLQPQDSSRPLETPAPGDRNVTHYGTGCRFLEVK